MTPALAIVEHLDRNVSDWASILTTSNLQLDARGLTRFPTVILGALVSAQRQATVLNLEPAVVAALRLIGADALLHLPAGGPLTMPFTSAVRADGSLLLRLQQSATTHPSMPGGAIKGWIEYLTIPAIAVDLSILTSVNSVVIAWALQLAHHVQPGKITLSGANRQVETQLKQLRLDRILTVI